jgi:hypothetical protein
MPRIGLKLKEQVKSIGVKNTYRLLREAIKEKKVKREEISLKEMAISFMGEQWYDKLDDFRETNIGKRQAFKLRESTEAVDASAFGAIGGQLLIDIVRDKYNVATQITDQLFTIIPETGGNLGPKIEPWLSDVIDDPAPIDQGMPYPATTFQPNYITLIRPQKYGRICRVTMEMLAGDKTKQAIDSAESVGRRTGVWVEYQRLKIILGLINNHSFNGTTYNTYQTAAPWVNKLTTFTLDNWKSLNQLEQLFAQMVDPTTGLPIDIDDQSLDMLVMPTARWNARRIVNATTVRAGNIAAAPGDQTESPNPIDISVNIFSSKHARKAAIDSGTYTANQADTILVAGNFKRAFYWRQVYPLKVVQAPPMNTYEFEQDIVLAVKSSVYGGAGVGDPRFVVFAYNSAA